MIIVKIVIFPLLLFFLAHAINSGKQQYRRIYRENLTCYVIQLQIVIGLKVLKYISLPYSIFTLECPSGYRDYINDSKYCYKIASRKKNWENARDSCSNYGGNLACFHSIQELSTLSEECKDCWVGYTRRRGNLVNCY